MPASARASRVQVVGFDDFGAEDNIDLDGHVRTKCEDGADVRRFALSHGLAIDERVE